MRDKTVILLLVFIGLLVYFNSLLNGFVKDDFPQIIENTKIHSISKIPEIFSGSTYEAGGTDKIAGIYYRPLMLTVYTILYALFGLEPFFFHLSQLILHIINSILVFYLFKQFFKNSIAFMISLIFLIHPINNETVVYIANLQDILFFFFGMLALLIIKKGKIMDAKNYLFFTILLFLSLLSKESGILFLIITIIFSLIFSKKNLKKILAGNIVIFLIYSYLRFAIARIFEAQVSVAQISNASLLERIFHIPSITNYYLTTFFFPLNLATDQYWFIEKLTWQTFYLPLIIFIIMIAIILTGGIFFYKKIKKIFKTYIFLSLWFLIGLSLHLQILPLDATVADRWFYFPIVGLLGISTLLIQQVKINSKIINKIIYIFFVLLIILLSYRTFQRNFNWKDELTLFGHDIHVTQRKYILDNLYATALIRNEEFKKAKPYVESSIKEYPFYANLNNMAIIYASEKNYKEAKKYLRKAVQESQYYMVYENYANFLLIYDDLKEAEIFTKESLKIFPKNPKLWMILAKIQYFRGNQKSALQSAENAYRIQRNEDYKKSLEAIKKNKLDNPRI